MTVDELIAELQKTRHAQGSGSLPVILCTQCCSGECATLEVGEHPVTGEKELWLQDTI